MYHVYRHEGNLKYQHYNNRQITTVLCYYARPPPFRGKSGMPQLRLPRHMPSSAVGKIEKFTYKWWVIFPALITIVPSHIVLIQPHSLIHIRTLK